MYIRYAFMAAIDWCESGSLTLTQDLVSLLQEAELVLSGLSHLADEVEEGGGDWALRALGL